MDFVNEDIERYCFDRTDKEPELLIQLQRITFENLEIPQMLTGRIEGRLLRMLALLVNAKRILEVGTFSGYSALSMAEALPEGGELFTCDEDPEAIAVARKFFNESPHGNKITLLEGLALESIAKLEGPFDLAFIDADKENYQNYYDAIFPMMRSGGLIVVDNVLWSGRVLNPEDPSDHAIANFNKKVAADDRVDHVMLTVRDGVYLLRKK